MSRLTEQTAALRYCSEHGHRWVKRGLADHYCTSCGYPRARVATSAGGWAFDRNQDGILRAHDLASGAWVQSPAERLRRIATLLSACIDADPAMRNFLGRDATVPEEA